MARWEIQEQFQALDTKLKAFNRGIDQKSPPHLIPDGFLQDCHNCRFTSGFPEKIGGYAPLFSGTGKPPDGANILFATQHILGATRLFIVFTNQGNIYNYADATGTFTLRRIIPTGANAWSAVTFGSTKIVSDGLNVPLRIDTSTKVTPLGTKPLAGFESTETWTASVGLSTFSGADVRTIASAGVKGFVEGLQGQRFVFSAGKLATVSNSDQGPYDIQTSPYSIAPNFSGADPGAGQITLRAFVNSGASNITGSWVRIGDVAQANYRQFPFTTLATGENLLTLPWSASTLVGLWLATSSASATIGITCGALGTADVTFDDLGMTYVNGPQAGSAYTEVHKSIYFQTGLLSIPYRVFFSNANNPSYLTPTDTIDIFDKQASDTRTETRALKSFFDTCIVGTRNTIFGINGQDRNTFTLSEQSSGQGITEHRSLVSFGDTFLYRFQNRMYAYSVSQLQAVSLPIEPLMDLFDDTFAMVAHRWIRHNQILWTYRNVGGTPIIICWDYGSGQRAWVQWDIPATAIFPYVDTLGNDLMLTVNTDGILYLHDQGAQFNGVDFDAIVQTRWLGAESAQVMKKWRRAYLNLNIPMLDPAYFSWRVADDPSQFPTAAWSTEVALDSTSLSEGTFADIGEAGRYLQMKIRQTASANILTSVFPLSLDPASPEPLPTSGFTGGIFTAFQIMPPLDVKVYILPGRRA